ncbi:unnamed protein product [Linum trigynum]|uniref:Uncharacterized protein n=1 Tax=Linum trigynum TaxID=586398 RepID=A0AAV2FLF9_9ROSI
MFPLRNPGALTAASFPQPWRTTSPFVPLSREFNTTAAPLPLLLRCSAKVEELSMEDGTRRVVNSTLALTTGDSFRRLLPRIREEEGEEEEEPQKQEDGDEGDEEDEKGISRIRVPRQKYIPVPKAELLDAILLKFFDSKEDADQFLNLSSCLDSILHAEHKNILEEMRVDYSVLDSVGSNEGTAEEGSSGGAEELNSVNGEGVNFVVDDGINGSESYGKLWEEAKAKYFKSGLDFKNLLGYSEGNGRRYKPGSSRLAVATRFQRAFMQLLDNAQFQELSASDLILTSALNSDYLLTLPIYVDWKKASESNAIIFRRGYATEREKGLLIGEKLDYIQSRLLQKIFFIASKPLGKVGKWIKQAVTDASETQEVHHWLKRMTLWVEELSSLRSSIIARYQASDDPQGPNELSDNDLPIWLAAQRAVSRYEGFLSPSGPRERLFRRLLTWTGLVPPVPEMSFEHGSESNASESHLRPIFLSRISLSDIWKPASRKFCGNNLWKMSKKAFSILLSQSVLQEPAFEELILLYTEDESGRDATYKDEVASLRLKIYERIPIPDLLVVFPHKKLSFRILDTVRLDAAAILGLSAYFINYKFVNLSSSPSAFVLDVIAITALIVSVSRVVLGYKQTWDRYQLLVNRTLYEKTLASGFGSVHFLLDASEQQQYKEAILSYAILLKAKSGQATCIRSVGEECERFVYNAFAVKVEMPVEKAVKTLLRLGLIAESPGSQPDGTSNKVEAVPCREAYEALKQRWNELLASHDIA